MCAYLSEPIAWILVSEIMGEFGNQEIWGNSTKYNTM